MRRAPTGASCWPAGKAPPLVPLIAIRLRVHARVRPAAQLAAIPNRPLGASRRRPSAARDVGFDALLASAAAWAGRDALAVFVHALPNVKTERSQVRQPLHGSLILSP